MSNESERSPVSVHRNRIQERHTVLHGFVGVSIPMLIFELGTAAVGVMLHIGGSMHRYFGTSDLELDSPDHFADLLHCDQERPLFPSLPRPDAKPQRPKESKNHKAFTAFSS
jgi:hypothetical protein